jgi:hypothetical protein
VADPGLLSGNSTVRPPYNNNDKPQEEPVGVAEILSQIDREIAQLQKARDLLAGSQSKSKSAPAAQKPAKKRRLTPEGRRRIAEAVKRRWAEQKKAQAGK